MEKVPVQYIKMLKLSVCSICFEGGKVICQERCQKRDFVLNLLS